MNRWIIGAAAVCMMVNIASAQKALTEIKLTPGRSVFKHAAWSEPIVIKTEQEAAKYFSKDALKKLTREVDFKKQVVLIFAWRGSGCDKMSCSVAESAPEQVFFSMKRGRTRDLRAHTNVYALRSNVKWHVKGKK